MDITFDTIIEYLSTKKDNFINKINIVRPNINVMMLNSITGSECISQP